MSMFSMPPAIAQSMKPSQISCAAVATACAPEPQTRFTVMRGHLDGHAAVDRCLTRRVHPVAGLDDVAHHDRADLGRVEARALEHRLDRGGAKRGSGRCLQAAAIGADGGSDRGADDDFAD